MQMREAREQKRSRAKPFCTCFVVCFCGRFSVFVCWPTNKHDTIPEQLL